MKISNLISLLVVVFMFTACSKSEESASMEPAASDQQQMEQSEGSENAAADQAPAESNEQSEHMLSGQQQAMEKAKEVEGTLKEAEEKRKKEMESAN